MNIEELIAWLREEQQARRLSAFQADEVIAQRRQFDQDRKWLGSEFDGKVVGYVADNRIVEDSVTLLLARAREYEGHMMYFEPVGRGTFT